MWTSSFTCSIGRPLDRDAVNADGGLTTAAARRVGDDGNGAETLVSASVTARPSGSSRGVYSVSVQVGKWRAWDTYRTQRRPVGRPSGMGRAVSTQGEWRTSLHAINIDDTPRLTGFANRLVGQVNSTIPQSSGGT